MAESDRVAVEEQLWPAPAFAPCPERIEQYPGSMECEELAPEPPASVPRIAACSPEAGPNETVLLTGTGLSDAEFYVAYYDAAGRLHTYLGETHIARDDYALVTIPSGLPRRLFLLWPVKHGVRGPAVRVNAAQLWWAYPDDPAAGDEVRLFGRELAALPEDGNAYVYLEPARGRATWVAPDISSRWELRFRLPEELAAGPCAIWVYAGSGCRYGWSNPLTVAVQSRQRQVDAEPLELAPFGLAGNGITDDTAALQRALDAAAREGRPVRLPAGRYVISSSLRVAEGVRLSGVSRTETRLICATPEPARRMNLVLGKPAGTWPEPRARTIEWRVDIPADGLYHIWLHNSASEPWQPKHETSVIVDGGDPVPFSEYYSPGGSGENLTDLGWTQVARVDLAKGTHTLQYRVAGRVPAFCLAVERWLFTDVPGWRPEGPAPAFPRTGHTVVVEAKNATGAAPGHEATYDVPDPVMVTGGRVVPVKTTPPPGLRDLPSNLEETCLWVGLNRRGFVEICGSRVTVDKLTISAGRDEDYLHALSVRPYPAEQRLGHINLQNLEVAGSLRGLYLQKADHVVLEDCLITAGCPLGVDDARQLRLSRCTLTARRMGARNMRGAISYDYFDKPKASSRDLIIEDCRFLADPRHGMPAVGGGFHAFPVATRNHYLARNSFPPSGFLPGQGRGGGEQILYEGAGYTPWFGHVVAAGRCHLSLPERGPDWDRLGAGLADGQFMVHVVRGNGLGQMRVVTGIDGATLCIDQPWNVVPDETSLVSVSDEHRNLLILDNDMADGLSGVQCWPSMVNSVMSGNLVRDMRGEGFLLFAPPTNMFCPPEDPSPRIDWAPGDRWQQCLCWWNLVENNLIDRTAVAVYISHGGIDTPEDRQCLEQRQCQWTSNLGNTARQNKATNPRMAGFAAGAYFRNNLGPLTEPNPAKLITGSIFELNHAVDAPIGFHVDEHARGVVIRQNQAYDWAAAKRSTMVYVETGAADVVVKDNAYEGRCWRCELDTKRVIYKLQGPRIPVKFRLGAKPGGWDAMTPEEWDELV